jgi:hypothetical protein
MGNGELEFSPPPGGGLSMKYGDVSRQRRLNDPVRQAYYAWNREIRFARFLGRELPPHSELVAKLLLDVERARGGPSPRTEEQGGLAFMLPGLTTGISPQGAPLTHSAC